MDSLDMLADQAALMGTINARPVKRSSKRRKKRSKASYLAAAAKAQETRKRNLALQRGEVKEDTNAEVKEVVKAIPSPPLLSRDIRLRTVIHSMQTSRKRKSTTRSQDREEEEARKKMTREYDVLMRVRQETVQEAIEQYTRDRTYYIDSWAKMGENCPIVSAQLAYQNVRDLETIKIMEDEDDEKAQRPYAISKKWEKGWCIGTVEDGHLKYYFVPFDDYRRPRIEDQFDENHVNTGHKILVNHKFAMYLRDCDPNRVAEIIYLDAPQGQTTSHLSVLGYTKDQLHCPNPNSEFVSKASPLFGQHATHYDGTVYELMRDLPENEEDAEGHHVGFDYCCTFEGNAQCVRPKSDIRLMFAKEVLRKRDGVCWMTFSTRLPKGGTVAAYLKSIENWVKAEGTRLGYNMELLEQGTYGKVAYFFWKTV
jgi:hypothetical protein